MRDSEKEREEAINTAIERGNIILKNYRDRYSGLTMHERSSIDPNRSLYAEVQEAQRLIDPLL